MFVRPLQIIEFNSPNSSKQILRIANVIQNHRQHCHRRRRQQGYKSLLRRELQAEFERRQLSDQFFDQNRDKIFTDKKVSGLLEQVEPNRASLELNEAVPPTETLNVEAQKARAELARQGSLADRNPPAGLALIRAKQPNISFEADVTYDDGAPVLDDSSPVSFLSWLLTKSVTRFGEISPVEQKFTNFWRFIFYLVNCWAHFGKFMTFLG